MRVRMTTTRNRVEKAESRIPGTPPMHDIGLSAARTKPPFSRPSARSRSGHNRSSMIAHRTAGLPHLLAPYPGCQRCEAYISGTARAVRCLQYFRNHCFSVQPLKAQDFANTKCAPAFTGGAPPCCDRACKYGPSGIDDGGRSDPGGAPRDHRVKNTRLLRNVLSA